MQSMQFQHLVSSKPKLANKIINGKLKDKVDPLVLRSERSDKLLCKSAEVVRETQHYYQTLNKASSNHALRYGPNTGCAYPWEEAGALDHFKMETHVGKEGFGFMNLDDHITNPVIFQRCLRNTKLGKTPGPDGICNEILRYLPEDMQQAIHKLFTVMWMTGHTPNQWKRSQTLLLYKKGDPLQLSNYRPIALANTIYKVWTAVITQVISTYAEHYQLLSDGQEGFRKHHNTMRALQNTLNVFEDAKLHQKNVFAMYTDYSNAFNTIDQDKLLQILFDLDIPNVAIDAVKDLYNGAITCVKIPAGNTDAIPVERGVLQGDTLSPLLFNFFMTPLVRWLQAGGRGYAFGSLEATTASSLVRTKRKTACSNYADDNSLFCNTVADLCLQAEKVHQYAKWGNLKIQPIKCAATGMPYADMASGTVGSPKSWVGYQQLKNRLACVKIGAHQIPCAHPHNDPQKVTGVSGWFPFPAQ